VSKKDLQRDLMWLISEILVDHKLGRLSVDSEDCAMSLKEKYGDLEDS